MSTSSPESRPLLQALTQTADGPLIGLLTICFYILFTLLPSSHSLMVSWPWVAVWQVTLILPIIWLLWQLWFKPLSQFKLGSGLDWPILLLVVGLGVSTLFAEFPNQALWYSWAALGGIAALYALSGWLKTPQQAIQLLKFQAALGIAFILVSLGLWLSQTYFPELERLAALGPYGVAQQFDFGVTSLRNWYPLGHQNYVAGYLVLILPLLFGLAITDRGWLRWLWGVGCFLGLVDLYTASSRGGLLALVVTVAIALIITLFRSQIPRRIVLPTGGLLLCVLITTTLGNSRVRRPVLALLQGKTNNSELGYRAITNVMGWRMGLDHPFTGVGPGNVLQLFQKYRPYWAGREAELHFQLHSTPAQLWAELGLWGIISLTTCISLLGWLTWCWANHSDSQPFINRILVWSLVGSLFAYGLMGLTDYQLDNLPISGVIVVNLALLTKVYQSPQQHDLTNAQAQWLSSRFWMTLGVGLLLTVNLWLMPVHRAWAWSKQGFDQLNRGNFDGFENALTQAHRLAPSEPYYPFMLAWMLGEVSYQTTGDSSQALRTAAIEWFERANIAAPYQEFGQSNLGWLLLQTQPEKAVVAFTNAAKLIPAKQGVFFGLGRALLANGQSQLAINAFVLECLRFPMLITSPIWQISEVATVRENVFSQLEQYYSDFLTITDDIQLVRHWQQMRGALYWWQGNYNAAAKDWQEFPSGQVLLQLSSQQSTLTAKTLSEDIIGQKAILAWLLPQQRASLLERGSIRAKNQLPQYNSALPSSEVIEKFVATMAQAKSFDDWLKNSTLISQPRSQRLGFGTLNRHIDGPFPSDYYTRITNRPISQFFGAMLPSPSWFQSLDISLEPHREALLKKVSS